MMTKQQKEDILQLVEDEKERLGSYKAVAVKCKLSEATISQLRKGVYAAEGDDAYETIALALGYDFNDKEWVIAETSNFLIFSEVLSDAKNESMFMGISAKAGSGKTAAADVFLRGNKRSGVYKINCKEWAGRAFLIEVAQEIGAEIPKGYASNMSLVGCISERFKKSAGMRPELILDQANSLKPSALRTLIHIFNECEDIVGVVILGTENLEYEIKRGVRLNKPGYDELDSRFGRKYIKPVGSNLADTRKICEANGITDKELQKSIFEECEPTRTALEDGRTVNTVEDMRRIKRVIKRERLKLRRHAD